MLQLARIAALAAAATALPAHALELAGAAPLPTPDGLQADASTGSWSQPYTAAAGVLQSIVWWGYHGVSSGGAASDDFVVMFDGVAQAGTLTKLVEAGGVTRYELDVPDQALAAGQLGTLDIVNQSLDVEWYWQYAQSQREVLAYSLVGAVVPEPATWALLLLGAAGLAAASRRKAEA